MRIGLLNFFLTLGGSSISQLFLLTINPMAVIISILQAAKTSFAAELINSLLNKYFYIFVRKMFLLFANFKIKKSNTNSLVKKNQELLFQIKKSSLCEYHKDLNLKVIDN